MHYEKDDDAFIVTVPLKFRETRILVVLKYFIIDIIIQKIPVIERFAGISRYYRGTLYYT